MTLIDRVCNGDDRQSQLRRYTIFVSVDFGKVLIAVTRAYVGQRFAQFEERTVLAGVLKNYEVVLDTSFPPPEECAEVKRVCVLLSIF